MAPLQNVALVGGTGNLGSSVLTALVESPLTVTLVTRKTDFSAPKGVKVVTVNYDDPSTLVAAFRGNDAVVSTIGSFAIHLQSKLIDAAIEAGVKRFIPSEFGADTFNEKSAKLPVYKGKVAIQDQLKKAAAAGKIEWTAILGGPFFDWGLSKGFLGFSIPDKTATLYDGGAGPISVVLLSDLGRAVVGVLTHPSETKNKPIYVQSARLSQLDLLSIFESLTKSTWERTEVDTAQREKEGLEKIGKGDFSGMRDVLIRALFGKGYGNDFQGRVGNSTVGVKELSKEDVTKLVKGVL
jgi:uncharacterized protein YbjT (DUF2867 family)